MERKRIDIYHIKRNDEKEFFLKPAMNPKEIINQKTESEVIINYGEKMSAEAIDLIKTDLYRYADDASRIWIDDLKLIPRFVFSLITSLAVVAFMAFVIPDPIPLADELLAGVLAGVILNSYLKSRYRKTVPAIRKRLELRTKADSLNYEHAPYISELQAVLNEIEGMNAEEAAGKIAVARSIAEKIPAEHRQSLKEILMGKIMSGKIFRKAFNSEMNKENIQNILELCAKKDIEQDIAALLLLVI